LLGDDRSPSVHAFDESLGDVAHRPETLRALQGESAIGCRASVASKLLYGVKRRLDWPNLLRS